MGETRSPQAAPAGREVSLTAPTRTLPEANIVRPDRDTLSPDRPFQSFFMGGFECSTHRRPAPGYQRLDLIASTGHDRFAFEDYTALQRFGICTVRDGIRWHLIEQRPGFYDFASALPQVRAARRAGTQVIWDVCHYGWPDDVDPFTPQFGRRLAGLAKAFVQLLIDEGQTSPILTPFNEISFVSYIGGTLGQFPPFAVHRGDELKRCLVQATIECIEAIRAVAPQARICTIDPIINIVGRPDDPAHCREAQAYANAQWAAWDMLAGRAAPELGGKPEYLDLIGVNYYVHNQWFHCPPGQVAELVKPTDPAYRPLSDMLRDVHVRYNRPVFVAETGIEGRRRARWLRSICDGVYTAITSGVPVLGICLYPIVDYPGWADDRHCPCGLLGYPDASGRRPVCRSLARELRAQQARFREHLTTGHWAA